MSPRIQKPPTRVNLLSEWFRLLDAVPLGYSQMAHAHLVGWLLTELARGTPEQHSRVREGMVEAVATTARIHESGKHTTARQYAEQIVSQMSDDDIKGILQQGSAEHWLDGIGLMMSGEEPYEAADVVREIESSLGVGKSAPAAEDRVIVETMPQHLRRSHKAANNSGSWPHNGAERFVVTRHVAEQLVEVDPEWSSILEGENLAGYEATP